MPKRSGSISLLGTGTQWVVWPGPGTNVWSPAAGMSANVGDMAPSSLSMSPWAVESTVSAVSTCARARETAWATSWEMPGSSSSSVAWGLTLRYSATQASTSSQTPPRFRFAVSTAPAAVSRMFAQLASASCRASPARPYRLMYATKASAESPFQAASTRVTEFPSTPSFSTVLDAAPRQRVATALIAAGSPLALSTSDTSA